MLAFRELFIQNHRMKTLDVILRQMRRTLHPSHNRLTDDRVFIPRTWVWFERAVAINGDASCGRNSWVRDIELVSSGVIDDRDVLRKRVCGRRERKKVMRRERFRESIVYAARNCRIRKDWWYAKSMDVEG